MFTYTVKNHHIDEVRAALRGGRVFSITQAGKSVKVKCHNIDRADTEAKLVDAGMRRS